MPRIKLFVLFCVVVIVVVLVEFSDSVDKKGMFFNFSIS